MGRFNQGGRGGRGRGRHNQKGCGRGSSSRSTSSSLSSSRVMMLTDYNYAIGSYKQASDYSSVTYFILNHLSKTLNQGHILVEALEKGQPIDPDTWKLTMNKSKDKPAADGQTTIKTPSRADKIEYQAQLELWLRNKELYKMNVAKAYATIWERCNTAMKNKILQKPNMKEISRTIPSSY